MTPSDDIIAKKITTYLDHGVADLKSGTAYRLQLARAEALARLADPVRRTAFHPQHERAVLRGEKIAVGLRDYARISFTSRPCTSVRR